MKLTASVNATQTNLAAFLVDYGPATLTRRNGEGVTTSTTAKNCWGAESTNDSPCYFEVSRVPSTVTQWRVSRGVLDSSNRESLIESEASDIVADQEY